MIGFGVTLPVLPFFTDRLAQANGGSRESVAIHVGMLTAVYALMQLVMAPVWGLWSDRIGRKRLMIIGIAGSMLAQILFGMSITLWLLYVSRIAAGILSSALFPAAAAYVSDVTNDHDRPMGMAWIGTSTSLGAIAGVALGGLSTRTDLHLELSFGHFRIDAFSVPFFLAAALSAAALVLTWRRLPESTPAATQTPSDSPGWWHFATRLRLPLSLAAASQFGLALFEGTFALFAQERLQYGPVQVGAAFVVCGLVMAAFQVPTATLLGAYWSMRSQLGTGFMLMALGSALLLAVTGKLLVLASIAILALGAAIIAPNLATLVSRSGRNHTGTALGAQAAANSLGQFAGPAVGGALFAWEFSAPYVFASGLLLFAALVAATQSGQHPNESDTKSESEEF
jgi:DHA1 family multidrug resistance protein-like MFS transporter